MNDLLLANLTSPLVLSFALGIVAKVIRSEFAMPRDVYAGISIYLLFALGLHGGAELRHADLAAIAWPATATLLLGAVTPVTAWWVLRRVGRFGAADAAGIAAHYGSVSAVTFLAAQSFVAATGSPVEGFLPTLLTLLESPGIHVALAIGAITTGHAGRGLRESLHEVVTGRTMVLLVGGLLVGAAISEPQWQQVAPMFDTGSPLFRGILCLFMLEMGLMCGARLGDVAKVGPFLIGFGVAMPVLHGMLGAWLGTLAGLSIGGATVLAAMAASASYIAAPPAVRLALPEANPSYSLTLALVITFPFNVAFGIPLYWRVASALGGQG